MKPWLRIPPKLAHDLAPLALQLAASFREIKTPVWKPFSWRGLQFQNRLGTAGGVDKDAELVEEWWAFGAGFVEVGTITPEPQAPNLGKIFDRDIQNRALWNRMGFPSSGVFVARENLRDLPGPRATPVFVNIGKNRTTSNDDAVRDYASCISALSGLADVIVINISSPNTTGLRELLEPQHLHRFLAGVLAARNRSDHADTPVLLKLSPDMLKEELKNVIDIACSLGIDGFTATNTTLARDHHSPFPHEGGVSGGPLAERSIATLGFILETLGSRRDGKLIVSAGGILTPEDVKNRLDMGCDLVQAYTALVYEGPWFFDQVARTFARS